MQRFEIYDRVLVPTRKSVSYTPQLASYYDAHNINRLWITSDEETSNFELVIVSYKNMYLSHTKKQKYAQSHEQCKHVHSI